MDIIQIIENSLYFLALINPISKILFISSKYPAYSKQELVSISIRSTIVAFLILMALASGGDFVMTKVFHVEIYSLSTAGGIILFIVGLNAVKNGSFFEINRETNKHPDVSIVPLAAPLIAGPGTMTAAISFASVNGIIKTVVCIAIAVLINMGCMLLSLKINKALEKVNATEPLIRIAGLIVTAVAMQMIFSGLTSWLQEI